MRSAREINDAQSARLLERMMKTGALKAGAKIAVLGAAYKADIDDARESPALLFTHAAKELGFTIAVHDPHVRPGDHHGLLTTNDLPACLKDAAAAVLLTEHKSYRTLSPELLKQHMKGRLIADARNALNHSALRAAGFTVVVLGDGRA
jgi:UDP-N-acetyl-D-mannosaminuronic acid dehydrogenase